MNKIFSMKTNISTLLFIMICIFFSLEACKKEKSTENIMTGKIKTSAWTTIAGNDTINADFRFVYDENGKLISIYNKTNDTALERLYAVIEYQKDEVIMHDSTSTDLTKYFLHPGTKLIDSTYYYYNGELQGGYKVNRDANNNILKISSRTEPTVLSDVIVIDSFNYGGININSFHFLWSSTFTPTISFNSSYNYNSGMANRPMNDPCNNWFLVLNLFSQQNKTIIFDLSILDISLGNTNANAISSVTNTFTTTYTYLDNSATHALVTFSCDPPNTLLISKLENTYFE